MKWEIERKFLVKSNDYRNNIKPCLFMQGYLSVDKNSTVRVRVTEKDSLITIKGRTENSKRLEYEYKIPIDEGKEILENLCIKPIIKKYRFILEYKGNKWEIDEFMGENEGLIVAEIELEYEDQEFEKPSWIGNEVTNDYKYSNSNLIKLPYNKW